MAHAAPTAGTIGGLVARRRYRTRPRMPQNAGPGPPCGTYGRTSSLAIRTLIIESPSSIRAATTARLHGLMTALYANVVA